MTQKEILVNALLKIYKDDTAPLVFYFTEDEAEFVADCLIADGIVVSPSEVCKTICKWNERVLQLMKQKGVTQKELSRRSGIAESSVSRYLHTETAPKFDIIVKFAKALEVEVGCLIEEADKSESAYKTIATAIAQRGDKLTAEEKNKLIALILGAD